MATGPRYHPRADPYNDRHNTPVRPEPPAPMTRSEAATKYAELMQHYLDRVARENITGYKEGGVELREAQEVRESHALTNQEIAKALAEVTGASEENALEFIGTFLDKMSRQQAKFYRTLRGHSSWVYDEKRGGGRPLKTNPDPEAAAKLAVSVQLPRVLEVEAAIKAVDINDNKYDRPRAAEIIRRHHLIDETGFPVMLPPEQRERYKQIVESCPEVRNES